MVHSNVESHYLTLAIWYVDLLNPNFCAILKYVHTFGDILQKKSKGDKKVGVGRSGMPNQLDVVYFI